MNNVYSYTRKGEVFKIKKPDANSTPEEHLFFDLLTEHRGIFETAEKAKEFANDPIRKLLHGFKF